MSTTHTSSADWQAAATIVGDAAAAESVQELGDTALLPFHRLLHSEFTTFDLYDRQGNMFYFRHFPAEDFSALLPPFREFFHQHPVVARWDQYTRGGEPMHLSEQMPVSQFLRTGLFNEVYLHQGMKYQLGFAGPIDSTRNWSMATGRLSADYSDREKKLSHFIRPQLARLVGRIARREKACTAAAALSGFFASADAAYALVSASGHIAELSQAARDLLARHVPGGLPDPGRLPAACAELHRALGAAPASGSAAAKRPTAPVFETYPAGSLHALVLRTFTDGTVLIIFQLPGTTQNSPLHPRLTRREAEILAWIGEGKTNPDIAALLGISPRTVEKHCENLFAKLGVESRLGAALLGRANKPGL